jgi:hypothetical protein
MMFSICVGLAPAAFLLRSTTRATNSRLSFSTRTASNNASIDKRLDNDIVDVATILQRPTWSLTGLSTEGQGAGDGAVFEITLERLRRLLRLSALPFIASSEEQAVKLKAIRTQLNFVRDIQKFDAAGSLPLQAIRDETRSALKEQTIGVEEVAGSLLQEEYFGRNRRPRRRKDKADAPDSRAWNPLEMASQKAGRYIVVGDTRQ